MNSFKTKVLNALNYFVLFIFAIIISVPQEISFDLLLLFVSVISAIVINHLYFSLLSGKLYKRSYFITFNYTYFQILKFRLKKLFSSISYLILFVFPFLIFLNTELTHKVQLVFCISALFQMIFSTFLFFILSDFIVDIGKKEMLRQLPIILFLILVIAKNEQVAVNVFNPLGAICGGVLYFLGYSANYIFYINQIFLITLILGMFYVIKNKFKEYIK